MNTLLRQDKELFNNLIKSTNLSDFQKIVPFLFEDREMLHIKFGKAPVLEQAGDGIQTCRIPLTYQFEFYLPGL